MGRSATVDRDDKLATTFGLATVMLESDPRWQLALRVVSSRHFARSPLLSKFLLYIVAETIEGKSAELAEHQIGVHVFDRPPAYRTVEDNIVRNYARQLRRRLVEYFAEEGAAEPIHIDIPLGGYVPVFAPAGQSEPAPSPSAHPAPDPAAHLILPDDSHPRLQPPPQDSAVPSRSRFLPKLLILTFYTAVVFAIAWFGGRYLMQRSADAAASPSTPTTALWNTLLKGPLATYIVPADAGLNIIEDVSRHPVTLADYIGGGLTGIPLASLDAHSAEDLRTQDFTSFVDLQTVFALAHLPEFDPHRAILRFPRYLRLDDLKNANAVIIGSMGSNPWAAIAENNANFRIVYRDGMEGATILNAKPRPGEAAAYVSHWNEPAHETFALISCLPNLEGNGRLLVLQGLDAAGTQAAGEALFHPAAIAPILRAATRPDGSLGYFEILLRATSIESSATGTQVIGSRIY